ncbi:MAG: FtsQ-type POTRA domain-containing protein [Pseudomonadota bacterium]
MRNARKERSVFLIRQTVRKHRGWTRRLKVAERLLVSFAIVIAGLVCLYGFYLMVFTGSTFATRQIVVEGKWKYLTVQGLADLSGVMEGDNLFWTSVAGVHAKLITNPWVRSTAVQRRLPGTLWIYVEEHQPVALLLTGEGLSYVDEDGEPFKRVEAGEDKNFPVFTGLSSALRDDGTLSDGDHVKEMLRIIELFRGSEFGRERDVAEIHYDVIKGYSLVTQREPMQIMFGHNAVAEGVGQLDRMRAAFAARPGRIQYMLADEPGRIIVKYQTS